MLPRVKRTTIYTYAPFGKPGGTREYGFSAGANSLRGSLTIYTRVFSVPPLGPPLEAITTDSILASFYA